VAHRLFNLNLSSVSKNVYKKLSEMKLSQEDIKFINKNNNKKHRIFITGI
jgi:hypothetical protein